MFKLGEMLTATQSVDDDTLRLLGQELDFDVQVVSPEDEDRELLETFDLEFGEDEGDETQRGAAAHARTLTLSGSADKGPIMRLLGPGDGDDGPIRQSRHVHGTALALLGEELRRLQDLFDEDRALPLRGGGEEVEVLPDGAPYGAGDSNEMVEAPQAPVHGGLNQRGRLFIETARLRMHQ